MPFLVSLIYMLLLFSKKLAIERTEKNYRKLETNDQVLHMRCVWRRIIIIIIIFKSDIITDPWLLM